MNTKVIFAALLIAATLLLAEATIKIRIHKKPVSFHIPSKISLGAIGHGDWWGQSWGGWGGNSWGGWGNSWGSWPSWSSWPSWGWGWEDDCWW